MKETATARECRLLEGVIADSGTKMSELYNCSVC